MVSPSGSGSGAGGSGSLGSPLTPTQREIETTAWTEYNKAALGIVPDSIDLSFTQLDKRYSASHLGTQTGYRASEDQPLLDHTLESVRTLHSPPLLNDESWNAAYQEIINQLPSGILARFNEEQLKPLNERDPAFTVAANVFKNLAKSLTKLALLSQPAASDSLEASRTQLNLIVSILGMKQSITNIKEAANKADEYLVEQGANLPHHDEYKNAIIEIKGAAETLGNLDITSLIDTKEEGAHDNNH